MFSPMTNHSVRTQGRQSLRAGNKNGAPSFPPKAVLPKDVLGLRSVHGPHHAGPEFHRASRKGALRALNVLTCSSPQYRCCRCSARPRGQASSQCSEQAVCAPISPQCQNESPPSMPMLVLIHLPPPSPHGCSEDPGNPQTDPPPQLKPLASPGLPQSSFTWPRRPSKAAPTGFSPTCAPSWAHETPVVSNPEPGLAISPQKRPPCRIKGCL